MLALQHKLLYATLMNQQSIIAIFLIETKLNCSSNNKHRRRQIMECHFSSLHFILYFLNLYALWMLLLGVEIADCPNYSNKPFALCN